MCDQCGSSESGSSDANDPTLRSMLDRAMSQLSPLSPHQSRLRTLLIGDPQSVWRIVELNQASLAEVSAWSDLIPIPNSNEVIRIHTERRSSFPEMLDRAGH